MINLSLHNHSFSFPAPWRHTPTDTHRHAHARGYFCILLLAHIQIRPPPFFIFISHVCSKICCFWSFAVSDAIKYRSMEGLKKYTLPCASNQIIKGDVRSCSVVVHQLDFTYTSAQVVFCPLGALLHRYDYSLLLPLATLIVCAQL